MSQSMRKGGPRQPGAVRAAVKRPTLEQQLAAALGHEDEADLGEIAADLDDLLREPTDFDDDAVALVADVRRSHCDGEGPAGCHW